MCKACPPTHSAKYVDGLHDLLVAQNNEITKLRHEVATLRHYGNKDCTAMADEALKALVEPEGDLDACPFCDGEAMHMSLMCETSAGTKISHGAECQLCVLGRNELWLPSRAQATRCWNTRGPRDGKG